MKKLLAFGLLVLLGNVTTAQQTIVMIPEQVFPQNLVLRLRPLEPITEASFGKEVSFRIVESSFSPSVVTALLIRPANGRQVSNQTKFDLAFLEVRPLGLKMPDGWSLRIDAELTLIAGNPKKSGVLLDPDETEIFISIKSSNWQQTLR